MEKFHPLLKEGHTREAAEQLDTVIRWMLEHIDLMELKMAVIKQREKAGEFNRA